jgi:prolipoprotein diacylglyceryltransferase
LAPEVIRIWDVPLLFGLWAGVALLVTEVVYRRVGSSRLAPGMVLSAAVLTDCAGRFFLEYRREEELVGMGLNLWQLMLLALAMISSLALARALHSRWRIANSDATLRPVRGRK